MSLGFIGTYTICTILFDLTVIQKTNSLSTFVHFFSKASAVLLLISYCVISLWYRVARKLHTVEQILVGLGLGTINALLWRILGITHVKDWVSHLLPNGYLPIPFMIIPALVGLVVVGSFERRLTSWLEKSKQNGIKLRLYKE